MNWLSPNATILLLGKSAIAVITITTTTTATTTTLTIGMQESYARVHSLVPNPCQGT